MKYIDAEKLKAEIERKRDNALERQKNLEKIGQETVLNEMIAAELNRLISFIDSLQQEQAEVDLKEEINRELDTRWKCEYLSTSKFRESARHFYELGLKARKNE